MIERFNLNTSAPLQLAIEKKFISQMNEVKKSLNTGQSLYKF